MNNKSWDVITEEDENGDIILPFPEDFITQTGWLEGDVLDFQISENGIVVTNLTADERNSNKDDTDSDKLA